MNIDDIKKRLHLRIEQADEKMLTVLSDMTENLFEAYLPHALEQPEAYHAESKNTLLRARTRKEMTNEIENAMEEYEEGKTISLEKSNREADSW